MNISQHLQRVDIDTLNAQNDNNNKEYLLKFYNEHKNSRFNPSLKQIAFIEKSFPLLPMTDHTEQVEKVVGKVNYGNKNTDNWISMCGFMNAFINRGIIELTPESICDGLKIIKLGIDNFKTLDLN